MGYGQTHHINTQVRTTTTSHLTQAFPRFVSIASGQPMQRRKQRRHEQQSIAAALAIAHHRSCDRKGKTKVVECEGREEAGSESAPPSEVAGPLGLAVTVGCVAAWAPVPAVSSLRGADGVDGTAVKFLLRGELKKKEEEKERKADEEKHERRMLALNHRVGEGLPLTDAEWSAWRKWATSSSTSAGNRRKRKLPKAGCRLCPPGCGRPCDHQPQIPALHDVREPGSASDSVHPQTLGIPVVTQRQVPTVHTFTLQVQFLEVADVPVEVQRQLRGSMVQKKWGCSAVAVRRRLSTSLSCRSPSSRRRDF